MRPACWPTSPAGPATSKCPSASSGLAGSRWRTSSCDSPATASAYEGSGSANADGTAPHNQAGREPAGDAGYPAGAAVVLRLYGRAVHRRRLLPRPGDPGAGHHVHRHGQLGHRHGLREALRRAETARRFAAHPAAAHRGQDGVGHRGRDRPGGAAAGRGGPGLWLAAGWWLGDRVGHRRPGTIAFTGLGLLMAGGLRAEATLAAANGLYLIFALIGGMFLPVDHLPRALAGLAPYLPADALADLLRSSLTGGGVSGLSLVVLLAWAALFVALAMRTFRWE